MPQDLNGSHIRLVSYDIKNGEQYVFLTTFEFFLFALMALVVYYIIPKNGAMGMAAYIKLHVLFFISCYNSMDDDTDYSCYIYRWNITWKA